LVVPDGFYRKVRLTWRWPALYSVVLGSPPPEDEDGADLWGGVGGVNAEIRAQNWAPWRCSAIVKACLGVIAFRSSEIKLDPD